MELAEMTTLTTVMKDKSLFSFVSNWRLLLDFLLEKGKNDILILGFDD